MAVLLREAIGDTLRRVRTAQSRTLREVSSNARVSLGYLSEVERGRKEASSELLAAICEALEVPLSEVLGDVSESLALNDRALNDRALNDRALNDRALGRGGAPVTRRGGVDVLPGVPRMVIPAPTVVRVAARAA